MSSIASKRKDPAPIACSLDAGALSSRLTALAELGDAFLVSREERDGKHLLRFRAEPGARRRLEEIVAAESECCAFLDLSLREEKGEIVLSIDSPAEGQPLADELAAAFSRTSGSTGSDEESRGRGLGMLLGAGGLAVAACCLVIPAALGLALGAKLGGALDAVAAALVVTGIGILVHRRRRQRRQGCC
jgi:hypothetical protein